MVTTGAIVMFLLDEDGTIVEGTRLTGVTVLSRFRPLPEFDGLRLATLDDNERPPVHPQRPSRHRQCPRQLPVLDHRTDPARTARSAVPVRRRAAANVPDVRRSDRRLHTPSPGPARSAASTPSTAKQPILLPRPR